MAANSWTNTFKLRAIKATAALVPEGLKSQMPQDDSAWLSAINQAQSTQARTLAADYDRAKKALASGSVGEALPALVAMSLALIDEAAPRDRDGLYAKLDRSPEIGLANFDGYHYVIERETFAKKLEAASKETIRRAVKAGDDTQKAARYWADLFNLYVNAGVDLWTSAAHDAGFELGRGQPVGTRVTPPLNTDDDSFRPPVDVDVTGYMAATLQSLEQGGVIKTIKMGGGDDDGNEFVFDEGISVTGDEARQTADQLANSNVRVDSQGVDRMKGLDEEALASLKKLGIDVKRTRREFSETRGGIKPGTSVSVGDFQFEMEGISSIELGSRAERPVFMQISDSALNTGRGEGSMNQKVVAAVIGANVGGVKACFERRLREIPDLSGRVFVEFTIGVDGVVKTVNVLENTSGDGPFAECLTRQVRRMNFPPPKGGEVTFVFPFIFEQSF
ncbi:MAG: AgmX/PglI C-terminal domain-containing protein [Candidatus Lernaella stagnicola]|nr:AgmX/PglI C-terminal domain-containing protein [Candidatus Lernaella stagnicola]